MDERRYPFGSSRWQGFRAYSPDEIAHLINERNLNEVEYRLVRAYLDLACQMRGILLPDSPAQMRAHVTLIPVETKLTIKTD
jgi:hypothetical protein